MKPKRKLIAAAEEEDWCFVCKDGGKLLLCDFEDCIKSYHPGCIGKKNSFLKTAAHWICRRHSCFVCKNPPKYYCLCCPNATCEFCLSDAEFSPVKGEKGLCRTCLELALLAEESAGIDSDDGIKMNFGDEVDEYLFKEYLEIIMDKESLTFNDFRRAQLKKIEILDGGQDVQLEVVDDENKIFAPVNQMEEHKEPEVYVFSGWASKPLIKFLQYVGNVAAKLSRLEVESVILQYIKEKNLFHKENNKLVMSDEMLYSIFRKKLVHINQIYRLLESHIAEHYENSEVGIETNECGKGTFVDCEKQRGPKPGAELLEKKLVSQVQKSSFASMVIENIKLVYLKRTLVEKLVAQTQDFEEKIVGCFVGVRKEYEKGIGKRSYLVLPVTDIIRTSNGVSNGAIFLQVSCIPADVNISLLSDDDISEEQCLDLQQKVKDGQLRKLTVVELEQKARSLHEDITKHRIESELIRLQKLIDFTNEKGDRARLEYYLEEREALKKPHVQQQLLQKLPRVTAEMEI